MPFILLSNFSVKLKQKFGRSSVSSLLSIFFFFFFDFLIVAFKLQSVTDLSQFFCPMHHFKDFNPGLPYDPVSM